MAYTHGVKTREIPTSITPPVNVSAGIPVAVGTAPAHLVENIPVNVPMIFYSYQEAVQAMGYSLDYEKYTLCEVISSAFELFAIAPIILINVLDPKIHFSEVAGKMYPLTNRVTTIEDTDALVNTVQVKVSSAGTALKIDEDYLLTRDTKGNMVITAIDGGTIAEDKTDIWVGYKRIDPSKVTSLDVIGGINVQTGAASGIELINEIFPRFRLVPGQLIAPKYSGDPVVAAIMGAKCANVSGNFKSICWVDIPTEEVDKYSDAGAWKNDQNIVSTHQLPCWPKIKLGDRQYHISSQAAALTCKVDSGVSDIPYVSPSNKNLQTTGTCFADGSEVFMTVQAANEMLNANGITTAINFTKGWTLWGNRTGAYPGSTDPKDTWIPVRRMFNWISNTIILTYWQKVDDPTNRPLIQNVTDSINYWLNSLVAKGALLGGRVEFRQDENPVVDLMNGIVRWHIYLGGVIPGETLEYILEYDPSYFSTLFGGEA